MELRKSVKRIYPSAAASPSRHALFLHLSRVLTAHELDEDSPKLYLERTRQVAGTQVDDLLDRSNHSSSAGRDPIRAVREDIMAGPGPWAASANHPALWYIAAFKHLAAATGRCNRHQYYRALVGKRSRTPSHALKRYFGHWKYPRNVSMAEPRFRKGHLDVCDRWVGRRWGADC